MWLVPILLVSAVFWFCVGWQVFGRTITYDMGGSIKDRVEEMQRLDGVRIDGDCFSACTMYLGLPQTCVTPLARLGFHSPATRSGLPLPREDWEVVTHLMAAQYPPALAKWYMDEGRYHRDPVVISGDQAIALGVPKCQ